MRQVLLCALVSALATPAGFGQQPQGASAAPPGSGAPVAILSVAPATPADDIKELKAAIKQLQERLNRLAPADSQARKADSSTGASESSSAEASKEKSSSPKSEAKTPTTEESDGSWSLTASWKNGLELKNKEDDFKVHVGGR